jgi:hypothetical protein
MSRGHARAGQRLSRLMAGDPVTEAEETEQPERAM